MGISHKREPASQPAARLPHIVPPSICCYATRGPISVCRSTTLSVAFGMPVKDRRAMLVG